MFVAQLTLQVITVCKSELDIAEHVRSVYAVQCDGEDVALGVCKHGDIRVGPLREIERHLGVVCVRALTRAH